MGVGVSNGSNGSLNMRNNAASVLWSDMQTSYKIAAN